MSELASESVGLVYLDPPFFTQKEQSLSPRTRDRRYSFCDSWPSLEAYSDFLDERLRECHRLLEKTGSIFFHCDRRASHVARGLLDQIFGEKQFRSEIIWTYRRWSNSQRGLLPSHQTILYYTKSDDFVFNEVFVDYSASTNVDQLLQKRRRDEFGKAIYSRDDEGNVVAAGAKRGVALGDVWDIPLLNPKASERVGYPTQKPILLLERIISLATPEGALVLDPFCGSGTTLVAAELLKRNSIGIDMSSEAIGIAEKRLQVPSKTESRLLKVGREAYATADMAALRHLDGIAAVPVHRNAGIDAICSRADIPGPILLRVQRPTETLHEASLKLASAADGKNAAALVVVATGVELFPPEHLPGGVLLVSTPAAAVEQIIRRLAAQPSAAPRATTARTSTRSLPSDPKRSRPPNQALQLTISLPPCGRSASRS